MDLEEINAQLRTAIGAIEEWRGRAQRAEAALAQEHDRAEDWKTRLIGAQEVGSRFLDERGERMVAEAQAAAIRAGCLVPYEGTAFALSGIVCLLCARHEAAPRDGAEIEHNAECPLRADAGTAILAALERSRRWARTWKALARKADIMSTSGWYEAGLAWDDRHAADQRANAADARADVFARLLERTGDALKGAPGPLEAHGWADLPEWARALRGLAERLAQQPCHHESGEQSVLCLGEMMCEPCRARLIVLSRDPPITDSR